MPEFVRIALSIVAMLSAAGALAWFLVWRAREAFALSAAAQRALVLLLLSGLLALIASRSLSARFDAYAAPLGAFGGTVMLAIVISGALLLPFELLRGLAQLARLARRRFARTPQRERTSVEATAAHPQVDAGATGASDSARAAHPQVDAGATGASDSARAAHPQVAAGATSASDSARAALPGRRAFVTQAVTGGALAFGSGAALYGTLFGRRDYTLETVPLVLDKLPRALDGLRIVQLSDLHVGTYVGERELAAALSLVRDARPDLIVLTGDLLDHDAAYAPTLARFARSLTGLARYGVHAIPGNHDYYAGVDATLSALREAGANVLLNSHVRIGDSGAAFLLGGLDELRAPLFGGVGPRPEQAFANTPDDLARVLLSHNPTSFHEARFHADLVLCGHTHGGQITMFVNPARLVLTDGLVRGHYRVDATQLYINRGFGTAGPPARIGSPPEVTALVLSGRA